MARLDMVATPTDLRVVCTTNPTRAMEYLPRLLTTMRRLPQLEALVDSLPSTGVTALLQEALANMAVLPPNQAKLLSP
jgi:hypothetical protein